MLCLDGDVETRLEAARAELLVAYLVLHRDAQLRRRLAFALWPDSAEAQAQTNLRKLLHTVRTRVPDLEHFLEVTPRTVRWRTETIRVDVDEFDQLTDPDRTAGEDRTATLRRAVACYGGDLLDGHDEPWLRADRDRLRARFLDALGELADVCEADGELAEAVAHAERLLRCDPLREEGYRRLMRLHAARGDPARALGVYHECSTVLESELGVAPSAATRAAYAELLPHETRDGAEPVAGPPALVGRAAERRRLVDLWRASARGPHPVRPGHG